MNKFTVQQFKEYFQAETGVALDFRKHVYLENQYGLSPCVKYDFAETFIKCLYAWGHQCIESNPALFPNFGGWQYNLNMSCEKLRTETISDRTESIVNTLNSNAYKISGMFDGTSVEWDTELGFLWLEKDGENQFQVCANFTKNGKPVIDKKNCGWNDGLCADFNFKKYDRFSFEEMEPIFEEFIRCIKQSKIKVV